MLQKSLRLGNVRQDKIPDNETSQAIIQNCEDEAYDCLGQ